MIIFHYITSYRHIIAQPLLVYLQWGLVNEKCFNFSVVFNPVQGPNIHIIKVLPHTRLLVFVQVPLQTVQLPGYAGANVNIIFFCKNKKISYSPGSTVQGTLAWIVNWLICLFCSNIKFIVRQQPGKSVNIEVKSFIDNLWMTRSLKTNNSAELYC